MTPGPLPDKWYSRDFPVLIEIVKQIDAGHGAPDVDDLTEPLGMSTAEVEQAIGALHTVRLVEGYGNQSAGGGTSWFGVRTIAPRAYTLTGVHPGDDDIAALVTAFEQAAEASEDPAEKTRTEGLRHPQGGFGRRG